jgi:outer membrane protein, heavy metal efflux system
MHHREVGQLEAQLKQLLNRPQESPDIQTEPLAARTLTYTASDLLSLIKQQNPNVKAQEAMLAKTDSQVELAKKEFRLDFAVQYMYQNTDRKFRDYYMAGFSNTLPNRGRRKPNLPRPRLTETKRTSSLKRKCSNGP